VEVTPEDGHSERTTKPIPLTTSKRATNQIVRSPKIESVAVKGLLLSRV